jgi:chromosome segregation ATPase
MTEAQTEHIKESVEGTIGSVKSAFAAHERAAETLSALGGKVSASVDHLTTRIDAVHIPPSLLEAKIDALLGKLIDTATTFERIANAEKDRHTDLAAASTELRRVVTQIGNQLAKLQATAQDLQSAASPAGEMAESLGRAKAALDVTTTAAKALADSAGEAREASRALTESIKDYGTMLVGVTNTHQATAAAAAADTEVARQRMARDLEESRAAVAEVQKVLTETARVVTQAINTPPVTG